MIYQYDGYSIEVKVTHELKQRIKLYVKAVYNMALTPSNNQLKAMFPQYDLRNNLSWLHILRLTEDKEEQMDIEKAKAEQKDSMQQIADKIDNALFTYTRTGLVSKGKNDTFMGYSWQLYENYRGERLFIGSVGYSTVINAYYFQKLRTGKIQPTQSIEQALSFLMKSTKQKHLLVAA